MATFSLQRPEFGVSAEVTPSIISAETIPFVGILTLRTIAFTKSTYFFADERRCHATRVHHSVKVVICPEDHQESSQLLDTSSYDQHLKECLTEGTVPTLTSSRG